MAAVTLLCSRCLLPSPDTAVKEKRFFLDTMICAACYQKMQKIKAAKNCFGKRSSNAYQAFDQMASECRRYCYDRRACIVFLKAKEHAKHA